MSSKSSKPKDDVDEVTEDAPSEASEKKEHRKKKHVSRSRKACASAPPGSSKNDGGLDSRMFGVPGSTPGCTAGAYATELDPDNVGEPNFASCFPEHAELAKDWLASNSSALSLSLLMAKFGPEPSVMDQMNKWLIRRVGRKCTEGSEEGRKDMASFAVEAIKNLRSLPVMPEATKLYRAVPWKAMGKLAPGMSEFCEESNIVWPTFTSLVKSEERARSLLKGEGGFLYVIEANQARDVTAIAPVQSGADEIMLEPNSQFVITSNENDGNIFIVGMKQEFPSLRPIMKEVDVHKHHHHHHRRSSTSSSSQFTDPISPVSPTITTSVHVSENKPLSVIVKAPPSPSPSSFAASGRMFSSQVSMRSSGSRLSLPSFKSSRRSSFQGIRPAHRANAALKSDAMTMWSAGKGYLQVHSVNFRDKSKVFKLKKNPKWADPEAPSTSGNPPSPPTPDSELATPVMEKLDPPTVESSPEKASASGSGSASEEEKTSVHSETVDDETLAGLSTDPGFGTMVLAPSMAPTFIVTGESVDLRTISGITPSVLMNRIHRGMTEMI